MIAAQYPTLLRASTGLDLDTERVSGGSEPVELINVFVEVCEEVVW